MAVLVGLLVAAALGAIVIWGESRVRRGIEPPFEPMSLRHLLDWIAAGTSADPVEMWLPSHFGIVPMEPPRERLVACPDCGRDMRPCNLARHRRRHEHRAVSA